MDLFSLFPLPWRRGASTSDGEPIYDAKGNLVTMVRAALPDARADEALQRLIVDAANARQASEDKTQTAAEAFLALSADEREQFSDIIDAPRRKSQ